MFDAIQHAMHLALRIVLTPETDLAVRGFVAKTNVKKVCARRRLDGSRCFRFGLRIYNFFGLFPTAKI